MKHVSLGPVLDWVSNCWGTAKNVVNLQTADAIPEQGPKSCSKSLEPQPRGFKSQPRIWDLFTPSLGGAEIRGRNHVRATDSGPVHPLTGPRRHMENPYRQTVEGTYNMKTKCL